MFPKEGKPTSKNSGGELGEADCRRRVSVCGEHGPRSAPAGDIIAVSGLGLFWIVAALRANTWIYSAPEWLDPWYYVGFGLSYTDPTFEVNNYKISRLPWILAQFAVRNTFDTRLSAAILSALPYFLFSLAIFMLVRRRSSTAVAFMISFAPYLLNYFISAVSGGADYHGLFSVSLFMLGISLSNAKRTRAQATGAVLVALSLHSNILLVNLLPLLIVTDRVSVMDWRALRSKILFRKSKFFVLAFVSVTSLLMGINWLVGRSPYFFMPQFRLASSFVRDPTNQAPWYRPWDLTWVQSNPVLIATVLALIAFLFARVIPRDSKNFGDVLGQDTVNWAIALAYAGVLWTIWQTLGQTAWQPNYFSTPILAPLLFFVAGLLVDVVRRTRISERPAIVVFGTILLVVGHEIDFPHTSAKILLPTLLFFTGLCFTVTFNGALIRRLALTTACFAVMLLPNSHDSDRFALPLRNFAETTPCSSREEIAQFIVSTHRHLTGLPGTAAQTAIWFPEKAENTVENTNPALSTTRVPDTNPETTVEMCGGSVTVASVGYSLTATGFQYAAWPPWPMPPISELDADAIAQAMVSGQLRRIIVLDSSGDSGVQLVLRLQASTGRLSGSANWSLSKAVGNELIGVWIVELISK